MFSSLFTQHKAVKGKIFTTALPKGKLNPCVQNVGIVVLLCVMYLLFIGTIECNYSKIYFVEKFDAFVVKMS